MIETDTTLLSPWADIHRILSNARSLKVVAGKETFSGPARFSIDDYGEVTLAFPSKKSPPKKKSPSKKK